MSNTHISRYMLNSHLAPYLERLNGHRNLLTVEPQSDSEVVQRELLKVALRIIDKPWPVYYR